MRLSGSVIAGILLLLLSNICFAQVQTARNVMIANSGGYYEYLPQGYNSGTQSYPLILFIHGLGETGNGTSQLPLVLNNALPRLINQGQFPPSFTVNGQTSRFIVISPQFMWWPVPADIQTILDYMVQHYRVDQSRIYLTGLSMGGGTTWDYAGANSEYANRLAAIVPVCGASTPEILRTRTVAEANLPVWATHNSGDQTVAAAYTHNYISQINTAPAPTPLAKKTIFEAGGHDAWTKTYDPNWKEDGIMNIYQWMLQYSRPVPGAGTPGNQAPVANAGAAQTIFLPSSSATLNGSGTDTDGSIVSYSWSQINGTTATITSPSTSGTTITGLTATGARVFRLKVTDDKGAIAVNDVTITVSPAPKLIPGRIESENWDAKSGSQYGVATSDPSGGSQHVAGIANGNWMDYNVNVATAGTYTVSFRVATTQGASQFQLKSGSTVLATFNVPNTGGWSNWSTATINATLPAGNQTLRLILTSSESANLNWMEFALSAGTPAPNQAPTANAGTNQNITLPVSTATLNGSGTDPDGSIASYEWTQVSGTASTIASPAAASTSISGLTTAGTRVFRLTVTDNKGATATSDVTITINPATAPAPGAKNIPGRIEAEAWDAKSGPQYAVSTNDGGGQQVVGIVNGSSMDYNVNVNTAGTYLVSFRVASTQRNAQLQLLSGATVLATVNVPNTGGWDVWTTVSISNVSLTAGNQTIRVISTNNETCNFNWFEFALTGGSTPNQAPVANAGTNQNVILPTSTTTLSGNGNDPDGTIVSYAWTEVSGPVATIANPSAPTTTISGLTTTGERVFRLTITDDLGAIATSDVTVMVNAGVSNGKTIPGRIEAENWDAKSGQQYIVSTTDNAGAQQVIGIANGNWMDYNVNVTTAGTYTVSFRVATTQWNSQFQIKSGNTVLATVNVPGTGGWSTWNWATGMVTLPAGNQTLRIVSTNNESCNLNWIDFSLSGARVAAATTATTTTTEQSTIMPQKVINADASSGALIDIYPNPVKDQFVLRSLNNYEGIMKIQMVDLNGRVVRELQVNKSKGRKEIPVSVSGLNPTTYFVKVQIGGYTQTIKMVKL